MVAGDGSDSLSINVSSRWNSAHTGVIYTPPFAPKHVQETGLRPYEAFHTILFFLSQAMSTGGYDNRAGGVQLRGELTQFTRIFPYWPPLSGSISRTEKRGSNYLITWTRARSVAGELCREGRRGVVDVF